MASRRGQPEFGPLNLAVIPEAVYQLFLDSHTKSMKLYAIHDHKYLQESTIAWET